MRGRCFSKGNVGQEISSETIALTVSLIGAPCFRVSWAGRTRLISAATRPRSRYSSVKWAPAYLSGAQLVRGLIAVRAAVHTPERLARGVDLDDWPPESVRHLRPLDAIVGTPGPTQTVLVRFVDPDNGRPRAVAKVMVSRAPGAADRIAAESQAIQDPLLEILVPRHRETGVVAGRHYLVTEFVAGRPVSSGCRGLGIAAGSLAFQASGTDIAEIQEHPWVRRALQRVPWLSRARLVGHFPRTRTHGDFAPWNILVRPGRELTLIDWEFSEPDGVAGVDLAHYVLVTQQLLKRRDPLSATRKGTAELQRVGGYSAEEARTLMALAAASVLMREPDAGREDTGSFWKCVIEHCEG
jgi:hypothetical protein